LDSFNYLIGLYIDYIPGDLTGSTLRDVSANFGVIEKVSIIHAYNKNSSHGCAFPIFKVDPVLQRSDKVDVRKKIFLL
jgi:hypothetical protein